MLRNTSYGSDPYKLLKILDTIILPTIDYASILYISSCVLYLKILDPILNTGIRLAIGACKTSPAKSLQAISSFHPLHIRRLKQLLNFTLKFYVMNSHPLNKRIKTTNQIPLTNSKSKRYIQFNERAFIEFKDTGKKYKISPHIVKPLENPKIAPWCFLNSCVDFSLAYSSNENMIPVIIQKKFLEMINPS